MKHHTSIIQHAIDGIESISPNSVYGCNLHHELFNMDYFIVGYYQAEQWINEMGGAFSVIKHIQNYETFNFGECSTDLSNSEAVANMYAYILGEFLLSEIKCLTDKWDEKLTESDFKEIEEELKKLL